MPKNQYYYYDHAASSFVEVKPSRTRQFVVASLVAVAALLLAGVFSLGLNAFVGTPQEIALQDENKALQKQLAQTEKRIAALSGRLSELSEADQEIYRALLGAEPISSDVRQAGIGGTDRYTGFDRFSTSTATLLRKTTQQLDAIERQMALQNQSYRELNQLAAQHEQWLTEMPAILPADGPVISSYGMRHHPILKITRMHPGVDILADVGTPVYATADGVVKEAGRNAGGYGIHVVIEHKASGYQTLYAHLSEIPENIQPGTRVTRGDMIGLSGNTGLSKGPHLHYEVRDLQDNTLNPIAFFAPSLTPEQYRSMLEASENATISLD